MITNKAVQKKPEHKQMMQLQSWYEPALRTLDGYVAIDYYDDVFVSAGNGYLNLAIIISAIEV
jgi:hypothetical protein